jgi:hypothetical protein
MLHNIIIIIIIISSIVKNQQRANLFVFVHELRHAATIFHFRLAPPQFVANLVEVIRHDKLLLCRFVHKTQDGSGRRSLYIYRVMCRRRRRSVMGRKTKVLG